ncbi:hypothetical protein D477_006979 [Arthrobacter crystallopoietes BAB-32]|uniref:DUF1963 domain-containing protein n=1 Tax=Arthrobacter crystallopoietes BAB-32 TaxID=1246476 RepID=N1V0T5_9MICC|nr:DUF1963 domain-containing protein [Arthrobacter crystallopoietes]EMY34930.1 hypothetical protein D477_006979 [Arthrobacter crystallopoietes BAB-32]
MARAAEPEPRINGTNAEIAAWLTSPAVNAPELADDIRFSVVLSSLNLPPGREDIDDLWDGKVHLSWLGGPAVGPVPEWPQRRDGRKLSHVAAIHLGEVAAVVENKHRAVWGSGMPDPADAGQSLPDAGVLEVFHDCETYGFEPADRDAQAWLVRWVPEPDGTVAEAPAGAEAPTDVCQVVIPSASLSLRSPEDNLALPETDFIRIEDAHDAILDAWQSYYKAGREKVYLPVSHLYGHSWKGISEAVDVLNAVLPLDAGDGHVLLLDLESWTHLEGWFGDAGHLEVWMRRSDLAGRDFGKAWCLVRMG